VFLWISRQRRTISGDVVQKIPAIPVCQIAAVGCQGVIEL